MANGIDINDRTGAAKKILTLEVTNAALGIAGHAQAYILVDGAGQNLASISSTGAQLVDQQNPSTGTVTTPATSTTDATILAPNANRKGGVIVNLAAVVLYVKFAAAAATAASFSYPLPASGGSCEIPAGYTGAVHAILASGGASTACVTEITP